MQPGSVEILDHVLTPLGTLCLRRRALLSDPGTVITEVTIDDALLMSSLHTRSETELARLALDGHPGTGLRVLVGGLGLGYTAAEALACDRVAHVVVVERLPEVISWLRLGLVPPAGDLREGPRLTLSQGDVYTQLLGPPGEPFDVLLIDVDHTPRDRLDEASAPFYTPDGLRRVAAHLSPGGVLAVWSAEGDEPFARALEGVFDEVAVHTVKWWNELVDTEKTDTVFVAVTPGPDPPTP